ncbi:Histidine--tRNA ligase [Dirofilaria immitis]
MLLGVAVALRVIKRYRIVSQFGIFRAVMEKGSAWGGCYGPSVDDVVIVLCQRSTVESGLFHRFFMVKNV